MACCQNTKYIGCYGTCGVLTTTFTATQTGVHTIEAEKAGVIYPQTFYAAIGEGFLINLSEFNENAIYKIRIKNPDDTYYTLTQSGTTYDCFELKTKLVYATAGLGDYNIDYNEDYYT